MWTPRSLKNGISIAQAAARLKAYHWVRFPSQKRIIGHIALNGRVPIVSTTMSAQWEVAGSSPAVSTEMAQRRAISPHWAREIHLSQILLSKMRLETITNRTA